jgi:hypothetical protein
VPAPKVTFRDLLTMADVIDFQESYDIEKTVPEMLYASGDCAGFALSAAMPGIFIHLTTIGPT